MGDRNPAWIAVVLGGARMDSMQLHSPTLKLFANFLMQTVLGKTFHVVGIVQNVQLENSSTRLVISHAQSV